MSQVCEDFQGCRLGRAGCSTGQRKHQDHIVLQQVLTDGCCIPACLITMVMCSVSCQHRGTSLHCQEHYLYSLRNNFWTKERLTSCVALVTCLHALCWAKSHLVSSSFSERDMLLPTPSIRWKILCTAVKCGTLFHEDMFQDEHKYGHIF